MTDVYEVLREAQILLKRAFVHSDGKCYACEAIDRIDALLANGGWMPIETAPKDGTLVQELEAEVERWKKEADRQYQYSGRLLDESYELEAELMALRRDAERYRWLRDIGMNPGIHLLDEFLKGQQVLMPPSTKPWPPSDRRAASVKGK